MDKSKTFHQLEQELKELRNGLLKATFKAGYIYCKLKRDLDWAWKDYSESVLGEKHV